MATSRPVIVERGTQRRCSQREKKRWKEAGRLRRPVNLHGALKSSKTRSVCECAPTVLINIQGYQETVDAMLADLDEYDLILRTKWGRAYKPELQTEWSSQSLRFWFRGKLIYWVPDVELEEEDEEQTFSTPPLLSSVQAKQAIQKGAVCHLVRLQTEIPFVFRRMEREIAEISRGQNHLQKGLEIAGEPPDLQR
eukprot:Cvel_429.t1-p1 / transcript=Cvel_429.t1 / gene=Cvel_429 / organism=Chromera_velia_CCMP2878 / gene_product=hypothetical protein / transcript_product=hypothetical protein / location=Cvel_scaffold14:563-2344(-) / protein_length=194 / sequence_SO=supercontig / SO=protein_coding / is_pseudo=false